MSRSSVPGFGEVDFIAFCPTADARAAFSFFHGLAVDEYNCGAHPKSDYRCFDYFHKGFQRFFASIKKRGSTASYFIGISFKAAQIFIHSYSIL